MHRAMALLCLLFALLDVRVERPGREAPGRICLAPHAPLALLPGATVPARPARVCLPPHWPPSAWRPAPAR